MSEKLDKYVLSSGMTILGEPMESVESAAFDFWIPAGAARMPEGMCGVGNVIEDWIFRGAGNRSSRELGDALDSLGIHRSSSLGSSHITIGAVLEASNLPSTIDLYADVILRPALDMEQFEPAKQLAIEQVRSLDDDPRHKVMLKIKERFYPKPLGTSTVGELKDLTNLSAGKTIEIIKEKFNPSEMIFALAGKYDFDKVCEQFERLFGGNNKHRSGQIQIGQKGSGYTHIHNDGAQVHIGLMTETVNIEDKDYYNARIAVSVLSGGMSARLFTEVREKRGLCYAVGAKYHCLKEMAGISCYAGTVPEKAQETIDVIIGEFNRLAEGIGEEEIHRAKAGLKSALIMQSESSSSRASGIGSDFYMLGRVRSLDEIREQVEKTTAESVLSFLRNYKFKDFCAVTIGPREVKLNG